MTTPDAFSAVASARITNAMGWRCTAPWCVYRMCFVTSRYLEIASVQFYGRPIRRCVRNAYSNKPIVRVGSGRTDDGGTTGARTTGRQAGPREGGLPSERASNVTLDYGFEK